MTGPAEIQIRNTTERKTTVHLKPDRLFMELLPLQIAINDPLFWG